MRHRDGGGEDPNGGENPDCSGLPANDDVEIVRGNPQSERPVKAPSRGCCVLQ